MRIVHNLKSWSSVTQRQPSIHENVTTIVAQCYPEPGKHCYLAFGRDVSLSFGTKAAEISSLISLLAQGAVRILEIVSGELYNIENTLTVIAYGCCVAFSRQMVSS